MEADQTNSGICPLCGEEYQDRDWDYEYEVPMYIHIGRMGEGLGSVCRQRPGHLPEKIQV